MPPNRDTLELINGEIRYRMDIQRRAIERVDTKATLLLGFAVAAAQFVVALQRDETMNRASFRVTSFGTS